MRRRAFCATAVSSLGLAALPFGRGFANSIRAPITSTVPAISRLGQQVTLSPAEVTELRDALRGPLLLRSSEGYDTARRIWNGAFDKYPALIARCAGAADVVASVQFARTHDLLVAVRGGGHSLPGHSTCDGGLMIDLSSMRSVRVDPAARAVHVEPGVLLGELDREAQAFGLAVPAGTVSHTGVAGLTLGGGIGRLGRKFGLTSDNLTSVDIVLANGTLTRASNEENRELFWGVRGGGGNFGVVTAFRFRAHPVGPLVTGGELHYRIEDARQVMRFLTEYAAEAPDEMWVEAIVVGATDADHKLQLLVCHCGEPRDAERELKSLRKLARPVHDDVRVQPLVAVQSAQDDLSPHGRGYYMTGGLLQRLENDLIDLSVESVRNPKTHQCRVFFTHIGGAIGRQASDYTAYPHRAGLHTMGVRVSWQDRSQSDAGLGWGRATWKQLEPFTRGHYTNFADSGPNARARVSYAGNLERLVALKTAVDPLNLFRLNPNIEPRTPSPAT